MTQIADEQPEAGALLDNEPHPAALDAKEWLLGYVRRHEPEHMHRMLEAFASTGMSGNRLGDVCAETLRRFMAGEPVSDRYCMGLCWTLRNMEDLEQ